jgi:hypothetical protein
MNWFQRLFAAPAPKAIAVTFEEGGNWHRFPCPEMSGPPRGITVHSIAFSNGTVWDAFNGWRPEFANRATIEHIERLLS